MEHPGTIPFLQTFAKCPFPETVREQMANCSVKVQIEKARRVMKLELAAPTLRQASSL